MYSDCAVSAADRAGATDLVLLGPSDELRDHRPYRLLDDVLERFHHAHGLRPRQTLSLELLDDREASAAIPVGTARTLLGVKVDGSPPRRVERAS